MRAEGRGPFFQQAILQSGSALSTWSVSYDPLWCTEKLAIGVNCSAFIGHSGKLVNCLRQRSLAELLNAAPQAPKYYSCFAPAIDEWTVLPTQVEKLIKVRGGTLRGAGGNCAGGVGVDCAGGGGVTVRAGWGDCAGVVGGWWRYRWDRGEIKSGWGWD